MSDSTVLPTRANFKNLTGQTFGRLIVVGYAGRAKNRQALWVCRCECGGEITTRGGNLRSGDSNSCGCLSRELSSARRKTHGLSRTVEYGTWDIMRQRCYSELHERYHDYGGRGIRVCDRWKDSFENFLADMGRRPSPQHSIDREDNSKDYSPSNCRWATRKEQSRNRRDNRMLTLNGKTQCVTDWSDETGFSHSTITHRLKRGWSVKRALTEPVKNKRSSKIV